MDAAVEVTTLRSDRLVAVLPTGHPPAGRRKIPLAALADEPIVVQRSRDRSSLHGRVLAACARAGFEPSALVEAGETATLVVFGAAGHGGALVPESVRSLRLGGVTCLLPVEAQTVDLGPVRRAGPDSPAAEQVAAVIESCVRR